MLALDQARLNMERALKLARQAARSHQPGGECVGPITLHLSLLAVMTDFLDLPKGEIPYERDCAAP
jgi:hypothetical protein